MSKKETKSKDFIHKPYFEGGQEAFKKFILDNLKYPQEAWDNDIEGTVHVHYDIDHKGRIIKAKASTNHGYGLEEEAIRLIKLLKFKVAKNRGLKVVFHKDTYIHFKKPKQKNEPTAEQSLQVNYHFKKEKPKQTNEGDSSYQYTIDIN